MCDSLILKRLEKNKTSNLNLGINSLTSDYLNLTNQISHDTIIGHIFVATDSFLVF